MKAKQVLDIALKLLGYTDSQGNPQLTRRIMNKAVELLNAVYSDIWYINHSDGFVRLSSLSDEINLPQRTVDEIMIYGVAMWIAKTEDDGANDQIFTREYNRKRAMLTQIKQRIDTLPRGC